MPVSIDEARQLLGTVRTELMSHVNVVATGIGYKFVNGRKTDQIALVCSVAAKQAKENLSSAALIKQEYDGIPTDVYPTGVIHALDDRKSRLRPAPGGCSIGHIYITAGTLGCLVRKSDGLHILSNNHVLANSNDARIGDIILQPGPADGGGAPQDRIGTLADFVPIEFENGESDCPAATSAANLLNSLAALFGRKTRLKAVTPLAAENRVDCAIAKPDSPDDVSQDILDIGRISGQAQATLGMEIQKSGRTTGYTTDQILQVDVTSKVSYGSNKTATFTDQFMAGAMSQGGDSGSAVLDMEKRIVGLLFAGSNTSTIINPIEFVFRELGVTLP